MSQVPLLGAVRWHVEIVGTSPVIAKAAADALLGSAWMRALQIRSMEVASMSYVGGADRPQPIDYERVVYQNDRIVYGDDDIHWSPVLAVFATGQSCMPDTETSTWLVENSGVYHRMVVCLLFCQPIILDNFNDLLRHQWEAYMRYKARPARCVYTTRGDLRDTWLYLYKILPRE
jgi:hypothetical protein